MKIDLIPVLNDNYTYLLQDAEGCVAIVDPGEAAPVIDALESRGLTPDWILNTHHHGDHIGGNKALKEKYGCKIAGPAVDTHRIDSLDRELKEGDAILGAQVLETPGHTSGHIVFFFPEAKALFSGDTLFSMGCGRLFEGTATQMWHSLGKILALPDDTQIYCGHEYTQANGAFCLSVEADNKDLQERMAEVEKLRAAGKPTIPVSLETEKKTNVFLRARSAERFAEIRKLKDNF